MQGTSVQDIEYQLCPACQPALKKSFQLDDSYVKFRRAVDRILTAEARYNHSISNVEEERETVWNQIKSSFWDGTSSKWISTATDRPMVPSTMARDPLAPSPDAVWPFARHPLSDTIGYHINGNVQPNEFRLNLLKSYFLTGVLQLLQEWGVSQQDKAAEEQLLQAMDYVRAVSIRGQCLFGEECDRPTGL